MKMSRLWAAAAVMITVMSAAGCSSQSSSEVTTAAQTKADNGQIPSETQESSVSETEAASEAVTAVSDTVKIGLVVNLSGSGRVYENGYKLAMDEINAAGGVYGAELVLESINSYGDAAEASNQSYNAVLNDPEIMLLSLEGDGSAKQVPQFFLNYEADRLAMLVLESYAGSLSDAGGCLFRMAVSETAAGTQLANVITNMGDTTAVVLYYDMTNFIPDYFGIRDSFCEQFAANGGEVLGSFSYDSGRVRNYSDILTEVKKLNPDCIVLCTPQENAWLIRQAASMGIKAHLVGCPGLFSGQSVTDLASEAAEDLLVYGRFAATDSDEKVQEFVKKYEDRFGERPNQEAASAYDQMYVIADAAGRAMAANEGELTRETLIEALQGTSYEGITGFVSFDENGDNLAEDGRIFQLKDSIYYPFNAQTGTTEGINVQKTAEEDFNPYDYVVSGISLSEPIQLDIIRSWHMGGYNDFPVSKLLDLVDRANQIAGGYGNEEMTYVHYGFIEPHYGSPQECSSYCGILCAVRYAGEEEDSYFLAVMEPSGTFYEYIPIPAGDIGSYGPGFTGKIKYTGGA